jgi:DNA-binding NarL/FixJ family response regulator
MTETNEPTIRVWLIEDNTLFRTGVQRGIDSLPGMECGLCFASAEAAFEALDTEEPPDVILLDVQLPGMDGIKALKILKDRAPRSRVMILTVFDDADKIFRAVCAGAAGYVLKSSGVDRIGEAIHQVMEGGAPMTPEVARKVLDAFTRIEPIAGATNDYQLTDREKEILGFMAGGLMKKEIAVKSGLSIHTVSSHIRHIYEKLQVSSNTAAVAKALREGLV